MRARLGSKDASCARLRTLALSASGTTPPRSITLAFGCACEGLIQLCDHRLKVALEAPGSAHQNVVMMRHTLFRQSRSQKLTKSPFHAIAHDSVADLLGYGHTKTLSAAAIGSRQQHETRLRVAKTLVRSDKIGAFGNDGQHPVTLTTNGPPMGAR